LHCDLYRLLYIFKIELSTATLPFDSAPLGLIGWWCLMPLPTIFQLYRAVSFIGGGNRSTQKKPPICRKWMTNFIT